MILAYKNAINDFADQTSNTSDILESLLYVLSGATCGVMIAVCVFVAWSLWMLKLIVALIKTNSYIHNTDELDDDKLLENNSQLSNLKKQEERSGDKWQENSSHLSNIKKENGSADK